MCILCLPLSLHGALPIFKGQEVRLGCLNQFLPGEKSTGIDEFQIGLTLNFGPRRVSRGARAFLSAQEATQDILAQVGGGIGDRKSTRVNSSHLVISYAVF